MEPYHYVDLDRKVVIDKSRLWDLGTLDRGEITLLLVVSYKAIRKTRGLEAVRCSL